MSGPPRDKALQRQDVERIEQLLRQGLTATEIVDVITKTTGRGSRTSIFLKVKRYKDTGSVWPAPYSVGRKVLILPEHEEFLLDFLSKNKSRPYTAKVLSDLLQQTFGLTTSAQTVQRCIQRPEFQKEVIRRSGSAVLKHRHKRPKKVPRPTPILQDNTASVVTGAGLMTFGFLLCMSAMTQTRPTVCQQAGTYDPTRGGQLRTIDPYVADEETPDPPAEESPLRPQSLRWQLPAWMTT